MPAYFFQMCGVNFIERSNGIRVNVQHGPNTTVESNIGTTISDRVELEQAL